MLSPEGGGAIVVIVALAGLVVLGAAVARINTEIDKKV